MFRDAALNQVLQPDPELKCHCKKVSGFVGHERWNYKLKRGEKELLLKEKKKNFKNFKNFLDCEPSLIFSSVHANPKRQEVVDCNFFL